MRQRKASAFPSEGRRRAPLSYPVRVCYRAIRGRPPFGMRWIWEREIERAIKNAKRTEFDKWFRKEWYKAGARRKWTRKRHNRWAPQHSGRCPAWR